MCTSFIFLSTPCLDNSNKSMNRRINDLKGNISFASGFQLIPNKSYFVSSVFSEVL